MCRYPPFDPFNTTYIPLPGVSDPRFALPLSTGCSLADNTDSEHRV